MGQTKVYDERSLALMFDALQAKLANRDFFDQASIAGAIGKFQGARQDTSAFGLNVTTTPIPGVTTETNATTAAGVTEKVTAAAVAAGATPGSPGTETTTTTSPSTVKQTVTQAAVTPAAAPLPAQTSAFSVQTPFGLAPQTLLSQQIELTHALENLQLLLEGSLTDRVLQAPISETRYDKTGVAYSKPLARARTVVGFQINLDSPRRYENAAAEVEITITTQTPVGLKPVSVAAVLPRENNYNVATVTKDAKQFGFGVAIQPISLGLSSQTQKETFYLVQDLDTVSFERAQPWNSFAPAGSVTFGWQFRPVLGQKVVKAGPRQVFASLALPNGDTSDFVGRVEVRTLWRKYDAKKKTVGDYIPGSDSYQQLDNLDIRAALLNTQPLQPDPIGVTWVDAGQGNIVVSSVGGFYLAGTGILLGNQLLDSPEKGFFRQGDKAFRWIVPGQRVALVEDVLLAGRYGLPAVLRDPLVSEDSPSRCRCLSITNVTTAPLDSANSRVRVTIQRSLPPVPIVAAGISPADFDPIIVLGNRAYGFSDAPVVKLSSITAPPYRNVTVEFVAPTQTLRDATKLTARLLFLGRDYTAELLAPNFTPPGGNSFFANKVVVISAGSTPRFGITGNGFNPANVMVEVDGVRIAANGVAGPNGARLNFIDQTLLNLTMPAALAKSVKQITLLQSGSPTLIPLAAPPSPIAKPKITSIDALNVGDQAYVTVNGENLGSIDKATFNGTQLKIKDVSDDGKTMQLLIIKDLSEKPGRRSIDFLSKDGTTEVSGDLTIKP